MLEEIEFEPSRLSLPDEPVGQLHLQDADATRALGEQLANRLDSGDFLGLVGQLGSGKTTLVTGLVDALGAPGPATSPTYTLVNAYETSVPVYHVDLYRLEGVDDLESIGYWDYLSEKRGIVCVEWLDRVPEAWPGDGIVVYLEHLDEGRRARIWASEDYHDRFDSISDALGGTQ